MWLHGHVDIYSHAMSAKGAKGLSDILQMMAQPICVFRPPDIALLVCMSLFRGACGDVLFNSEVDGVGVDRRVDRWVFRSPQSRENRPEKIGAGVP